MNLTCYVLDDDAHAVDAVVKNIDKTPELICVGNNTNPTTALKEIKLTKPDIVFLDVEMPELSGIEVADLLPEGTLIVFITSHSKYAVEAIQKHAVGYLLKPFSFHMFVSCVNKIRDRIVKAESTKQVTSINKLFINSGTKGKIIQITISEILYIEALKNMVCIHTQQQDYHLRVSIKNILTQLPAALFVRVHRSYIVNIDLIRSVEGDTVTILNDISVPFGELYKSRFIGVIKSRTLRC